MTNTTAQVSDYHWEVHWKANPKSTAKVLKTDIRTTCHRKWDRTCHLTGSCLKQTNQHSQRIWTGSKSWYSKCPGKNPKLLFM